MLILQTAEFRTESCYLFMHVKITRVHRKHVRT